MTLKAIAQKLLNEEKPFTTRKSMFGYELAIPMHSQDIDGKFILHIFANGDLFFSMEFDDGSSPRFGHANVTTEFFDGCTVGMATTKDFSTPVTMSFPYQAVATADAEMMFNWIEHRLKNAKTELPQYCYRDEETYMGF